MILFLFATNVVVLIVRQIMGHVEELRGHGRSEFKKAKAAKLEKNIEKIQAGGARGALSSCIRMHGAVAWAYSVGCLPKPAFF